MEQAEKESYFREVMEQYGAMISKVCYMYATDSDHFKDLYQECLINLWQGIDRFRGEARLSTWIYRACLNTCVTYYRRNKKYEANASIEMLAEISVEDSTRRADLVEMYRLISRLNSMEKAIILLWLDEKSYDEISEITGVSRNNVASKLRRIKAKLVEYGNE